MNELWKARGRVARRNRTDEDDDWATDFDDDEDYLFGLSRVSLT